MLAYSSQNKPLPGENPYETMNANIAGIKYNDTSSAAKDASEALGGGVTALIVGKVAQKFITGVAATLLAPELLGIGAGAGVVWLIGSIFF